MRHFSEQAFADLEPAGEFDVASMSAEEDEDEWDFWPLSSPEVWEELSPPGPSAVSLVVNGQVTTPKDTLVWKPIRLLRSLYVSTEAMWAAELTEGHVDLYCQVTVLSFSPFLGISQPPQVESHYWERLA
eukprot:2927586-Rhodomonas_salina.3